MFYKFEGFNPANGWPTRKKLEELARQLDMELTVVVPPYWRDERGVLAVAAEERLARVLLDLADKLPVERFDMTRVTANQPALPVDEVLVKIPARIFTGKRHRVL